VSVGQKWDFILPAMCTHTSMHAQPHIQFPEWVIRSQKYTHSVILWTVSEKKERKRNTSISHIKNNKIVVF
jgi:hypothetical protein